MGELRSFRKWPAGRGACLLSLSAHCSFIAFCTTSEERAGDAESKDSECKRSVRRRRVLIALDYLITAILITITLYFEYFELEN